MKPSLPPRLSLRGWPLLGLAALLLAGVLLALVWTGTGPADAQGDELHVAITASPANPVVEETVRFRAIISNAPSQESPSYHWELHAGRGNWFSAGKNATFSFVSANPGSTTFRVTVTYDTGESATSDPLTVEWTEPTPTPSRTYSGAHA